MKTKEIVAIIGATGDVGASIARNLSMHSYRLILMSSDAEKLRLLKGDLFTSSKKAIIDSTDCAKECSWEADIIIIAPHDSTEREIAKKIKDVATGKIVISISDPLSDTYIDPAASSNTSAAEELQRLLPNSKVVKVFAADSNVPAIDGKKTDAFVAANNGYALEAVSKIIAAAGFDPLVVGDLAVSRTLDRMQVMRMQIALNSNRKQKPLHR